MAVGGVSSIEVAVLPVLSGIPQTITMSCRYSVVVSLGISSYILVTRINLTRAFESCSNKVQLIVGEYPGDNKLSAREVGEYVGDGGVQPRS
jgi:hypothetical protein